MAEEIQKVKEVHKVARYRSWRRFRKWRRYRRQKILFVIDFTVTLEVTPRQTVSESVSYPCKPC